MKILFCCQLYAPSVGGVQEVIRQISERLVEKGHQVTVATTTLPNRTSSVLNGVFIKEFYVNGNAVTGMTGEVVGYQNFVLTGEFDVILIYAAQQWTFDALWPVLDKIQSIKLFVPCGFSGLYEAGYKSYYENIPSILGKFDQLIFNAKRYRDIDFVKNQGISKISIIPNGASELEFNVTADENFRKNHGIPENSFVFLTVGSFTGLKGHQELATAFKSLSINETLHVTLILNGNEVQRLERNISSLGRKMLGLVRTYGVISALKQLFSKLLGRSASVRTIAESINSYSRNKLVIISNFSRAELIQTFMAADLFVLASNIEYSPLVLFEAVAAGTPFLTVDVGNSLEIASWTGAGISCPSIVDSNGYTRVREDDLMNAMMALVSKKKELAELGRIGHENWIKDFTWNSIASKYEALFLKLMMMRST